MVTLALFCTLTGVISSVLGFTTPQLSRRILHEHRRSAPTGWSLYRRADPDSILPLSIALVQSNIENLEGYLLDVSDPDSPNYGKHWTPAHVKETFRPSEESVDTVHSWLAADGVHPERIQLSPDGAYIRVNVSVAEAERLLATEYYVYQHGETGAEHVSCQHGYHLPEHVSQHVDLVTPTVHFGAITASTTASRGLHAKRSLTRRAGLRRPSGALKTAVKETSDKCDEQITLSCIRELYDFNYDLVAADRNTIGVVEVGTQNYNEDDLDEFFKRYAPDQVGSRPTLISVDGGYENTSTTDGDLIGESNLDFELVMGLLGHKQQVFLYQDGGDDFFEDLLSALDTRCCKEYDGQNCWDMPRSNVISISYGGAEDGPPADMIRKCNEMGKLSLTGITVVYASGDNGMSFAGTCLAANGTEVEGEGNFLPDFPGSCQYLTAVGSTQVNPGSTTSDPESATSGFASGGGFSNVFSRPCFQERAVQNYLKQHTPSQYGPHVFNRTGRAYPDIAANGANIVTVGSGEIQLSGGTSASAPIVAAMLTAVNDARIAAGKSPIGWINPALYSHMFANVWNDITDGSNPACGKDGFPATSGWDPVTGLGTPNFPRLLSRFLALP
ncbi:subtilisin-like protein [Trametes maxima]|nr:subtilisin-like protein [Trametes maxima]